MPRNVESFCHGQELSQKQGCFLKLFYFCSAFKKQTVPTDRYSSKWCKMKRRNLKKYIRVAVLFTVAGTLGACNRGVGCPSDFSLQYYLETFLSVFQ